MTNDINTLNGALAELGETMADNLVAKGVTASASDGLTTLAGKILDIPTGGGSCYHIEFSNASYTAVGGSASLEVYLQENYAPKSGGTVSVTGSDGSSYTGITDSLGVASVTVSNISSETTFTASYNNVSDTCTVNVITYIINDDATADNSSTLFGTSYALRNSGTNTTGWNSDGYYTVKTQSSGQRESMRVLTPLTGLTDDFIFEYDSYIEGSSGSSGFVIYNGSTSWCKLTDDGDSGKGMWWGYNTGSFVEEKFYGNIVTNKKWVHYKYTIQGNSFTMEVTYNDSTVASHTETIPITISSSTQFGLDSEWQPSTTTRYKNIVAYTI